jgi:hypothetical protein
MVEVQGQRGFNNNIPTKEIWGQYLILILQNSEFFIRISSFWVSSPCHSDRRKHSGKQIDALLQH